jgi:HPt (histidine-containing phosphotransfer) domain-containing protein
LAWNIHSKASSVIGRYLAAFEEIFPMNQDNANHENKIGSELVREDPSFADIVIQFVDGLDDRLETMNTALSNADFEALRVAAHQLKGSGGGYGYPVLTERAGELEEFAKQQSVDACSEAFQSLKQICSRVVVTHHSD